MHQDDHAKFQSIYENLERQFLHEVEGITSPPQWPRAGNAAALATILECLGKILHKDDHA